MTDEPVTHYDARSQRVTNAVCNAAPHHTTPHHTTKNTSSLSAAQTLVATIRAIPEVDALTRLVASVRPSWDVLAIRRAIERDDRPWSIVVDAFWRGSNDPHVAHPNGLRYVGGVYETTVPVLPTVAEALAPQLCAHEFRFGACPFCRQEAK